MVLMSPMGYTLAVVSSFVPHVHAQGRPGANPNTLLGD